MQRDIGEREEAYHAPNPDQRAKSCEVSSGCDDKRCQHEKQAPPTYTMQQRLDRVRAQGAAKHPERVEAKLDQRQAAGDEHQRFEGGHVHGAASYRPSRPQATSEA